MRLTEATLDVLAGLGGLAERAASVIRFQRAEIKELIAKLATAELAVRNQALLIRRLQKPLRAPHSSIAVIPLRHGESEEQESG